MHALQQRSERASAIAVAAFPASAWASAWSPAVARIDGDADRAFSALYASSDNALEQAKRAHGVLVFPRIHRGIGRQEGDGVMRRGLRAGGYYRITATTLAQSAAQKFSLVFFFMTQAALDRLDRAEGWAVGETPAHDVFAAPFVQNGLMASFGLEGSRIVRLPDAGASA